MSRPDKQSVPASIPLLLTPTELAALLRLHVKTVLRLARERRLPQVRFGRSIRFRRSDVEKLIDASTVLPMRPVSKRVLKKIVKAT